MKMKIPIEIDTYLKYKVYIYRKHICVYKKISIVIPIENIMRITCITHTYHPIHAHIKIVFQLGTQGTVAHPTALKRKRFSKM